MGGLEINPFEIRFSKCMANSIAHEMFDWKGRALFTYKYYSTNKKGKDTRAMLSAHSLSHLYAIRLKAYKFISTFPWLFIITMFQTLFVIVYRMQMFHTYHLINNNKLCNRAEIEDKSILWLLCHQTLKIIHLRQEKRKVQKWSKSKSILIN